MTGYHISKKDLEKTGFLSPDPKVKAEGVLTPELLKDAIGKIANDGNLMPTEPPLIHPQHALLLGRQSGKSYMTLQQVADRMGHSFEETVSPEEIVYDVTLLKRKIGDYEFTDEQLQEFLIDSCNAEFEVSKLVEKQENTEIPEKYHDHLAVPMQIWIEERGIVSNIVPRPKEFLSTVGFSIDRINQLYGFEKTKVLDSRPKMPNSTTIRQKKVNVRITDEMIEDGQWDVVNKLVQNAAKAMAGKAEEQLFHSFGVTQQLLTTGEEPNKNGRVYTKQAIDSATSAYNVLNRPDSDQ